MLRGLRLSAIAITLVVSVAASALSNEDIERRFQQLEQENNSLRQKLEQVEALLKQRGIDPSSSLIEQRVTASEKNNNVVSQRIDRFEQTVVEDRDRIKINGFVSSGFTTNDEKGGLNHRPYDFNSGADFESDAVLGVQMDFRINDQAKVVTQLVANGWDGWDANIGWAYLAYEFDQHWEVRAGRMRLPLYLYSESLDVGYSYPWVRPPLSLYITEISDYDGFDATYRFSAGEANHRVSAFYGGYRFKEQTVDLDASIEGDDALGINWTTDWNDWTFRLAYSHLSTTASFAQQGFIPPANVVPSDIQVPGSTTTLGTPLFFEGQLSETINYYSYATAYDNGDWLAILEVSVQEVSERNFIGDEVLGEFTLGHRFDKWMPYAGYGREYYKEALAPDNLFARVKDRDYKMNFVGLRYDITPGIAAKLEWDHFYDFKGTPGPFESPDAFVNGDSFDAVDVYTFLIDAVF